MTGTIIGKISRHIYQNNIKSYAFSKKSIMLYNSCKWLASSTKLEKYMHLQWWTSNSLTSFRWGGGRGAEREVNWSAGSCGCRVTQRWCDKLCCLSTDCSLHRRSSWRTCRSSSLIYTSSPSSVLKGQRSKVQHESTHFKCFEFRTSEKKE